jgi:hypothetical protein
MKILFSSPKGTKLEAYKYFPVRISVIPGSFLGSEAGYLNVAVVFVT